MRTLELDDSVPISKIDELKKLHNKGLIGEYLALCFLYAVSRQNALGDVPVEFSDLPLLSEVGNKCPICHLPLVRTIKGRSVKKYKIVKVFPDDLDATTSDEFVAARKPVKKLDSNDNKLALCEECAESYELQPEVDEYIELSGLKEQSSKSYAMQQEIAKLGLEEEMIEVIEALADLKNIDKIEKLSMDALKLDEKILPENAILKHSLTENVLTYYKFIENIFSQIEVDVNGNFGLIANQISVTYKKMEKTDRSQDEIVNDIAMWIHETTNMGSRHLLACHIIVAFFVQNCEVFYAISK